MTIRENFVENFNSQSFSFLKNLSCNGNFLRVLFHIHVERANERKEECDGFNLLIILNILTRSLCDMIYLVTPNDPQIQQECNINELK